ncbi:MAG: hypothetical protein CL677_03795 [Bdellovibrionaceae bacterium]|nr:hypothetical protein [Pseudobdellovibrionaceae bacterium]|tara:strand:- start:35509 stop:36144 length:636 start_codon:yes stop_codon:yes gene_type:complete
MSDWRVLANRWQKNQILLGALLLTFCIVKLFLHSKFDNTYWDLTTDVLAAMSGLFLFWDKLLFRWHWKHIGWVSIVFCFLSGLSFYYVSEMAFTWIPFDYGTLESRVILLGVHPIIEELAYRFAIFWAVYQILKNNAIAVVFSAVLFGLASSWESIYVPSSLQGFLYFKGITLSIMSCWWGFRYVKTESLIVPIGLHFFFKLGFFAAILLK